MKGTFIVAGTSILCFHYEAISPNAVLVPSRRLRLQRDVQHTWLHKEVDELAQVYSCLLATTVGVSVWLLDVLHGTVAALPLQACYANNTSQSLMYAQHTQTSQQQLKTACHVLPVVLPVTAIMIPLSAIAIA